MSFGQIEFERSRGAGFEPFRTPGLFESGQRSIFYVRHKRHPAFRKERGRHQMPFPWKRHPAFHRERPSHAAYGHRLFKWELELVRYPHRRPR